MQKVNLTLELRLTSVSVRETQLWGNKQIEAQRRQIKPDKQLTGLTDVSAAVDSGGIDNIPVFTFTEPLHDGCGQQREPPSTRPAPRKPIVIIILLHPGTSIPFFHFNKAYNAFPFTVPKGRDSPLRCRSWSCSRVARCTLYISVRLCPYQY